jgi:hypothetical protein
MNRGTKFFDRDILMRIEMIMADGQNRENRLLSPSIFCYNFYSGNYLFFFFDDQDKTISMN